MNPLCRHYLTRRECDECSPKEPRQHFGVLSKRVIRYCGRCQHLADGHRPECHALGCPCPEAVNIAAVEVAETK